jgi:hypothetical protein
MFEVFTKPERANVLTSPENATWKAVRRAAVAALNMNNLRWGWWSAWAWSVSRVQLAVALQQKRGVGGVKFS